MVFAAVTSTKLGTFIAGIQATIANDPAILLGVTLAGVFVPMLLALVLGRDDD